MSRGRWEGLGARASAGLLAGTSRFPVAGTGVKQVERDCDVDGPRLVGAP